MANSEVGHATLAQIQHLRKIADDAASAALGEFGLSALGAESVLEHRDEFVTAIKDGVHRTLQELSRPNKYRTEEVPSTHGYYSGYKGPRKLLKQVNMLRSFFPHTKFETVGSASEIFYKHAEGNFVIPNWKLMGETYGQALETVLLAIKHTRLGEKYNYRSGQLGPERLRESERKVHFFEMLRNAQGNPDLLIVPAQFGIQHRGRSVRRVRELLLPNECPLGAFEVGIMLLLHSDRLGDPKDLAIHCAGDEYDPGEHSDFSAAPVYRPYEQGTVVFGDEGIMLCRADCGSATAFISPAKA